MVTVQLGQSHLNREVTEPTLGSFPREVVGTARACLAKDFLVVPVWVCHRPSPEDRITYPCGSRGCATIRGQRFGDLGGVGMRQGLQRRVRAGGVAIALAAGVFALSSSSAIADSASDPTRASFHD